MQASTKQNRVSLRTSCARRGAIAKAMGPVVLAVGVIALAYVWMTGPARTSPADTPGLPVNERLGVVVAIPPLAWIPIALGVPVEEVHVVVPQGATPHAHELTAGDYTKFSSAKLAIGTGFGLPRSFEIVADRQEQEGLVVVRLASFAAGLPPAAAGDPHAWLDPLVMHEAIAAVGEVLGSTPDAIAHAQEQALHIHHEYKAAFEQGRIPQLATQHMAWGYLENRYGLNITASIQGLSHTIEPTPLAVSGVSHAMREGHAQAIVVEPIVDQTLARTLAERAGVPTITLDPLGSTDWPATMRANLQQLLSVADETQSIFSEPHYDPAAHQCNDPSHHHHQHHHGEHDH